MSAGFLSDRWYRAADSRPRLKPDLQPMRQRQRGRVWYVLHDRNQNRSHRFSPAAWLLASRLDGRQTLDAIWQQLVEELGESAPGQDETLRLLAQLHGADLLASAEAPDAGELIRRRERQMRMQRLQRWLNPMALRFPLWDCDRFLLATLPWLRGVFTRTGLLLWLAWVLPALFLAAGHWPVLTGNLSDQLLGQQNLLLLALVFPVVKLLHELGHAYATRAAGGEVHEMGLMLLVFAPAPYVDASAAGAIRSKHYRAFVGAAGMMTELALAAGALYLWLVLEPGLARSIAFNVMAVAGFSTLVFNGNPLLRYDGYYILCDLAELPNLGQRSTQYWAWLARHHLFGERELPAPPATPGEKRWFLFYAPAALVYRCLVSVSIALFVANQYFFVGVALALWSMTTMLGLPLVKMAGHVFGHASRGRRLRTVSISAGLCTLLAGLVGWVPMPSSTVAEGVVWVPAQAELRAGGDGWVDALSARQGEAVQTGQPVLQLQDEALQAELAERRARVRELEIRAIAELAEDRVQAALSREALTEARTALAETGQRVADLTLRAGSDGRLMLDRAADLPGRPLRRGDWIGYVLAGEALRTVRVTVGQDDIDRVRSALLTVSAMPADRIGTAYPVRVLRAVPAGEDRLPSRALAHEGGGLHATDPRDEQGTRVLSRLFQFDLELPPEADGLRLGTRVYVRFGHPPEALATRLARRLRQLFLSQLHV